MLRRLFLRGSIHHSEILIRNRRYYVTAVSEAVLWTSKIAGHNRNGEYKQGLSMFRQMQLHGVMPDNVTFITALKACAKEGNLAEGKLIHAEIVEAGLLWQVSVGNALINMYGKCSSLVGAREIFDTMQQTDVISWNSMITVYAQHWHFGEALELFQQMQVGEVEPDNVTFIAALNACSAPCSLEVGKMIHSLVVERGLLESDIVLGNACVNMYTKCGSLENASNVFESMQVRDVVSWNAIISAYAQHDQGKSALQHFRYMQLDGILMDKITFVTVLKACLDPSLLAESKMIHSCIIEQGFETDMIVRNALMNTYGKCGSLENARRMFDKLHQRDVVSWNAMITAYAQHGHCMEALELYQSMELENMVPNKITFVTTLNACTTPEALAQGKMIHARTIEFGFESDLIVGNALVNMYSKCGSPGDARAMFDRMVERDVVTWNAMTAAYVHHSQDKAALQLFRHMLLGSLTPDKITFATILGACANQTALPDGKLIHSCISEGGFESDVVVASALVIMYSKCQSIHDAFMIFQSMHRPAIVVWNAMIETCIQHWMFNEARKMFDRMEERDVGSWNAVIAAYVEQSSSKEAFQLFQEMQLEGVMPNRSTLLTMLNTCSSPRSLAQAKIVHNRIRESGFESDEALGSALVKMFGKCGSLEEARRVFNALPQRDVVSWTTMIAAYAQDGNCVEALELFQQMQLAHMIPDSFTLVTILNACTGPEMLEEGKLLHARIMESGCDSELVVGNALVTMYGKCGTLDDALDVFWKMPHRGVVSWNAMIAAYTHQGCSKEAFQMFQQMQMEGVEPNNVTFITILNACTSPTVLKEVKFLHACDIEKRVEADVAVGNALLNMYGKCGNVEDAHRLFERMAKQRDVVTWNAMITANVQHGNFKEALHLFEQMQLQGMMPNNVTFITILNVCAAPQVLDQGKLIHCLILESGLEADVALGNAIINMYGKCWSLEDARKVFDGMPRRDIITWNGMIGAYAQLGQCAETRKLFDEMKERDIVTWNTIIAAHAQHGQCKEALHLFRCMTLEGMVPNSITLVAILGACAGSAALAEGRKVHRLVIERSLDSELFVGNALVDMYGKCGSLENARKVFNRMCDKDVVTWNGMIAAYAQNGHTEEALKLFLEMQREGKKPTDITFVSIFSACSHAGRLDLASEYFASLSHDYGVVPIPSHYGCMVDLLGRAGRLDEAEVFIKKMPPEQRVAALPWMTLLSACRVHGDVDRGRTAAEQVFKWDPQNSAANVVLSNIYASATRSDVSVEEYKVEETIAEPKGLLEQNW